MAVADIIAAACATNATHFNGGGTHYLVKDTSTGNQYLFFVDTASDLVYTKSEDGGFTWNIPVTIRTGTLVAHANWYRRWSGLSSDRIEIVYTDANTIFHRSLDISTDTLSSETTVFSGASSASGGALTVTVGRDGRIAVAGSIDNGVEDGAWSSTDDGATWGDTIADPSEGATQDQYYLLPGWNADTADLMLVFVDASANGLSVKRYDDNLNTWSESAIIADGSFIDTTAGSTYPHVAVTVDLANSQNLVVAWTQVDTANADLRCFKIDDTTITETATNIVLNSSDDQGLCAISIETDTGDWYVYYGGKSDGSQTFNTAISVYYKVSTDDGATWGSETIASAAIQNYTISWMTTVPRIDSIPFVAWISDQVNDKIYINTRIPSGSSGGSPIMHSAVIQ